MMKIAILLLVCVSATLALAEEQEVAVTEEVEVASRKLLDYRSTPRYCDPHDHVITCKGYNEFCKPLSHPFCKNVKKCDHKKRVCVKYGYRYSGHGYGKKKVKYCVKYDYRTNCHYKKVCYKYACAKRH